MGYGEAVRWSKNKEAFGKGNLEGVISSETANNAANLLLTMLYTVLELLVKFGDVLKISFFFTFWTSKGPPLEHRPARQLGGPSMSDGAQDGSETQNNAGKLLLTTLYNVLEVLVKF